MITDEIYQRFSKSIYDWGRLAGELMFHLRCWMSGDTLYSKFELDKYLEAAKTRQEVKEVMQEEKP